jgi:hypothetical protein
MAVMLALMYIKYSVEIGLVGMIHIPKFMKFGKGVQGILRCCLSNLKGCNFGIKYGRYL